MTTYEYSGGSGSGEDGPVVLRISYIQEGEEGRNEHFLSLFKGGPVPVLHNGTRDDDYNGYVSLKDRGGASSNLNSNVDTR